MMKFDSPKTIKLPELLTALGLNTLIEQSFCHYRAHISVEVTCLLDTIMHKSVNLLAQRDLEELKGPASFYDRWLKWQSQSDTQAVHQQIADELAKTLQAEPVK